MTESSRAGGRPTFPEWKVPEQHPHPDSPHAALRWVPPPCPPSHPAVVRSLPGPAPPALGGQVSDMDQSRFTRAVCPGTRRFRACEAGGPSHAKGAVGASSQLPLKPPSPQLDRGHGGPVLNRFQRRQGLGLSNSQAVQRLPSPTPIRAFPERPAHTAQRAQAFPARTSQAGTRPSPAAPEEQSKREPQGWRGPWEWQAGT